jgi:hypothetical protein
MNRRDFLLFHAEGSKQVADLSCEKLFMHYQDLNSGFQRAVEEAGTLDDADWWAGEPSLLVNSMEPEAFFRKVLDELSDVEAVLVQDMEWLAQGDFRIRVETLLSAFKAGGGEVNYKSLDKQNTDNKMKEEVKKEEKAPS